MEYFGDVNYREDGMLIVDRKKKPWKTEDVKKHVRKQLYENRVFALTGKEVDLPVKDFPISTCCHSDSPGCVENVWRRDRWQMCLIRRRVPGK